MRPQIANFFKISWGGGGGIPPDPPTGSRLRRSRFHARPAQTPPPPPPPSKNPGYGPAFDVTLVVEDGKEFKVHRQVLSEASPFFEKLLNTDMIESREGVARLDMLTEAGLRDILEFIYTGSVQISIGSHARDLIEMADYLCIPKLRTLAGGVLAQELDTSNCISTYYFAKRYHCEELVSDARELIFKKFTIVGKAEEFRNLSSDEVKQWISSNEIQVSAEEDVFVIILSWIGSNHSERRKYFAELFRLVRLVNVSRDYLSSKILTNPLANNNEYCLELVMSAMRSIESGNSENLYFPPPRKSLETSVLVVTVQKAEEKLLCYVPLRNTWYKLRDTPQLCDQVVSCHSKLYFVSKRDKKLLCYDSFFDQWTPLTLERERDLLQIFVNNGGEDEIYALELDNERSCCDCASLRSRGSGGTEGNGPDRVSEMLSCGKQHPSYITKYKPESNSWEDMASFRFDLGIRKGVCIVAKYNFVYFIGGVTQGTNKVLADVDRYDLTKREWDKMAHIQEAREQAYGTAGQGKIFITGGSSMVSVSTTCEVYNEATNEWQFIASRRMPRRCDSMMFVENKIYVLDGYVWNANGLRGQIECYESDENEWKEITDIPVVQNMYAWYLLHSCPMRVFKRGNHHWTRVIT